MCSIMFYIRIDTLVYFVIYFAFVYTICVGSTRRNLWKKFSPRDFLLRYGVFSCHEMTKKKESGRVVHANMNKIYLFGEIPFMSSIYILYFRQILVRCIRDAVVNYSWEMNTARYVFSLWRVKYIIISVLSTIYNSLLVEIYNYSSRYIIHRDNATKYNM